jgi:hypothetical protein
MGVMHVFASAVLAGVCPLPLGQVRRLSGLVVRRALDTPGALGSDGQLTMGFAREYLPMVESYSGPGSPYWAAKAFGFLALPGHDPFWTSQEELLPVERSDYLVASPATGFLVRGDHATGQVQVVNSKSLVSAKKYSNLTYSSHFGYEIDHDRTLGATDPFGEAALTLSRDGRRWYGKHSVRSVDIRDGVVFSEAIYLLGESKLAGTARTVSGVLSASGPRAGSHDVRQWIRARARSVYMRLAPKLIPKATVLSAVMFVGDQQIRAHRVRSRVKILAREGGFACGWTGDVEPELTWGSLSFVHTPGAASGIRIVRGYERAVTPHRSDHNVLHSRSWIPRLETVRARRGLLRIASVSLARPVSFSGDEIGSGMGAEAARLIALLERIASSTRSRSQGQIGRFVGARLGTLCRRKVSRFRADV